MPETEHLTEKRHADVDLNARAVRGGMLASRAVLPDHGLVLLPYLCGCHVAHRRGSLRTLTCPAHFARVAS